MAETGSSGPYRPPFQRNNRPIARHCVAGLAPLVLAGCAAFGAADETLVLHGSFGTAASVLVEGRVGERVAFVEATPEDGRRLNLERNIAVFVAEECERCPLALSLGGGEGVATRTDDEGYFRAELVPGATADGWQPLELDDGEVRAGRTEVLIVPPGNRLGIVSDIDDTVLVTDVADVFRMVGNTFLKNPLQREAVPGVAALYARLLADNPRPAAAPMLYLSSSPRQLHDYLSDFLAANGFPRGVLITRRLSLDDGSDPLLDPVAYKTARLEDILERLPDVRFVLVGDDGEHDPEVYAEVRRRHPERVAAIWIRRTGTDPEDGGLPPGQRALADVLTEVEAGRAPLQR